MPAGSKAMPAPPKPVRTRDDALVASEYRVHASCTKWHLEHVFGRTQPEKAPGLLHPKAKAALDDERCASGFGRMFDPKTLMYGKDDTESTTVSNNNSADAQNRTTRKRGRSAWFYQGAVTPGCESMRGAGDDCKLSVRNSKMCAGKGLFAKRAFKPGEVITRYGGELVSSREAQLRGKQYDRCGVSYIFELCGYTGVCLDAMSCGTKARFANHAQTGKKECNADASVTGGPTTGAPLCVVLRAGPRGICAGDEIAFDYGPLASGMLPAA